MKWTKKDLVRQSDQEIRFAEEFHPDNDLVAMHPRIRRFLDAHIEGKGRFDQVSGHLFLTIDIQGHVIVPCDITLEDVQVPVQSSDDLEFSFMNEGNPDLYYAEDGVLDTDPVVMQLIDMDIPTKVVKPGLKEYPKGDNWEIISEVQYEQEKRNRKDPRMAKLSEFKFESED